MSYLQQYDNTPESEQFPLVRHWMKSSPLAFFEELRAERPILVTPEATLLALHQDITDALYNPRVFTVQLYEAKMGSYLMAQDDTPVHYREKSIMQSMLNRDDLVNVRQLIGTWTNDFLNDASNNTIDAVNGLTRRVPITLVQKYMGFDTASNDDIAAWSLWNQWNTFHNQPFDDNPDPQAINDKMLEVNKQLQVYLGELVPRRMKDIAAGTAPDDIVCRLLKSKFPEALDFPMERLVRNIGGLLIGTIETTSQATAQALQYLLRDDKNLAKAKIAAQSEDHTLFDGFVFEALRFDPISPYLFRKTGSDYVMARGTSRETLIKSDTTVLPLVLSGMFDSSKYPEPGKFKPERPLDDAFHLGIGLHECLGKYIGLAMIPEMIRQVLLRPNVRPISAIQYNDTPFPDEYQIQWD